MFKVTKLDDQNGIEHPLRVLEVSREPMALLNDVHFEALKLVYKMLIIFVT